MKTKSLNVTLTLTEPQLGTIPKNREIFATHVATKSLELAGKTRNEIQRTVAEESETIQEAVEEKGWTGFHQDEKGIFIYDYMIRGFLKTAATALKDQFGLKNVKSKIDTFVFVFPRRIYFQKEGAPVKSVDGVVERPLRAQTMQGPRVTLARSDYMNAGTKLTFEIKVVESAKEFTVEVVKSLFEYGELQGLGQFRNGSYGRFTVEIE